MTRKEYEEKLVSLLNSLEHFSWKICGGNIIDAEDLRQDVYIKLHKEINPKISKTYVGAVMKNANIDRYKTNFKHTNNHFELESIYNTKNIRSNVFDIIELYEIKRLADEVLTPEEKSMFIHYIEGYTLKDTSKIFNMTEKAIKMKNFYLRKKIRVSLLRRTKNNVYETVL